MSTNPYDLVLEEIDSPLKEDNVRSDYRSRKIAQLKQEGCVNVDHYLAGEKIDDRFCASLIYRPVSLYADINKIQQQLASLEFADKLWTYPNKSLHMTLLEIKLFSTPEGLQEMSETLNLRDKPLVIDEQLQVTLSRPQLNIDQGGIALTFISEGRSHLQLRSFLYNSVRERSLVPEGRYYGSSAHITIARFIRPLSKDEVERLISTVDRVNASISNLRFQINNAELCSGLNWYGCV